MPTTEQANKNFALSPAASDLGLGDQLKAQLADANEERKVKSRNGPPLGDGTPTDSTLSMSPAVSQLLMNAGGIYG